MPTPTKSTSPFGIFRGASWTNGKKKPKQANLGEESNMYFHPTLKRWVERGKEEEAEKEAAGPPPPPVMSSGSITSTPLSKRSLSQRYVLQPNLSVSSSMASLAGSTSQTDLAAMCPGFGDVVSGPQSAIGSTTPSPPQSGSSLLPPGAYSASGSPAPGFFIPTPRQSSAPPSPPAFFVPSSPGPEDCVDKGSDPHAEPAQQGLQNSTAGSTAAPVDTDITCSGMEPPVTDRSITDPNASPPDGRRQAPVSDGLNGRTCSADMDQHLVSTSFAGDSLGTADSNTTDRGPSALASTASRTLSSAAELSLRNCLATGRVHSSNAQSVSELSTPEEAPPGDSLSFPSPRDRQMGSPVSLVATAAPVAVAGDMAGEEQHQLLGQQQQLLFAREYRRLGGGGGPNASDGGAAISLHEGMGVAPAGRVQHHGVHQPGLKEGSRPDGDDELAGALGTGPGGDDGQAGLIATQFPALVVGDAMVIEGGEPGEPVGNGALEPVAAGSGDAAGTDSAADSGGSAGGQTLHSQYYYQQYAYLYQYAQEQGYNEADAVSYAHYYAAMYAQQYEAQAPEGQLGDGAVAATDAERGADARASTAVEQEQQLSNGISVDGERQAAAMEVGDAAPTIVFTQGAHVEQVDLVQLTPMDAAAGQVAEERAAEVERFAVREVLAPEVPVVDSLLVSVAPLPLELTVAAAAATAHHQQSAVTAAVTAIAAAVGQQAAVASGLAAADRAVALSEAAAAAHAPSSAAASAAVAPQLLIGRLGQLSSAATAAVASLGASVAATAPIAAALSAAATAAASTAAAAAVAAGGFAGLEGGLTEDDFERIMHPGDPAKLDGPLPWELPEHLRTGRKFLALCANWQLANPGQPYAPQLLLQALEQPEQQQQQQAAVAPESVASAQPSEQEQPRLPVAPSDGGDVALAAEGGSGSADGATPAVEEPLSSYERACRLSEFGQPAAVLLAKPQEPAGKPEQPATTGDAPPAEPARPSPLPEPLQQVVAPVDEVQQAQSPGAESSTPNGEVYVVAAGGPADKPGAEPFTEGLSVPPPPEGLSPIAVAVAEVARPAAHPLDLGLLPAVDSPQGQLTPGSNRSEDPFSGTEHVPLAQQLLQMQMLQKSSPVGSPAGTVRPRGGLTLEQALEQEREAAEAGGEPQSAILPGAASVAAEEGPAAGREFRQMSAVEAADFFEHLGDEAQAPADALAQPVGEVIEAVAADGETDGLGCPATDSESPEGAAAVPGETNVSGTGPAAPAATAAAAAIDSVVQALEQLRSSAAAGDSGAVADPAAGTALLLQIQSSLAQATEALAGMGVDVSALATLAGAPAASPAARTPAGGHKRPRVEASPGTPTRVAAAAPASESAVATPLLPPGPLLMRPAGEETAAADAAAVAPGDRFQQLGRRLSDAVDGAGSGRGAACAQPQMQEQIVMSLTVASAPEVDVAAVEEQVRGEERSAWEARMAAVVDSEREAAALVIAAVERERDGLQQRVGDLEQALARAAAEREEFLQRLEAMRVEAQGAAAAGAGAEAERSALSSQLSQVVAERDSLAVQLASEREEKALLAEALTCARADNEELRQRYTARFNELTAELEATRASLSELQGEHDELLLCLGQESTKVAALTDALQEAGGDPTPLIEQIEAEYENMGLGGGTGGCERDGGEVPDGQAAEVGELTEEQPIEAGGEGWEGEDLML